MNRREVLALLLLNGALPAVCLAQAPALRRRVSVVAVGSLSQPPLASLVQGLRELGHVEGRDIEYEHPFEAGDLTALAQMSARAVERKADVIVTYGTTATRSAVKATKVIPIVAVLGSDPVQLGLVKNLARPEGNLTGLATQTQMLAGKRIELIREIVPGLRRLAVLWNPAGTAQAGNLRLVQNEAGRLGIGVQVIEIKSVGDLDAASAALSKERPDGLLEIPSTVFRSIQNQILKLAVAHKLPAVYGDASSARAGGLVSYSPDVSAQFRRAALFVDRILKGAKPAELPIEQPSRLTLVLNLKTARALGIVIPQSVLVRADEVIQ